MKVTKALFTSKLIKLSKILTYVGKKEDARQKAINWQYKIANKNLYYSELAEQSNKYFKLAKRYGLIKEFKKNGIL